jgi:tetrahydromethanopterin S-methyltransferase subunit B
MAPLSIDVMGLRKRLLGPETPPTRENLSKEGGFLEAWTQGYNVGSLIMLILIVLCNYKSGIWLHKLILLEVRSNYTLRT